MRKITLFALFAPAVLAACTPDEAEDPHELEGAGAAAESVVPLGTAEGAQVDESQEVAPMIDGLGDEGSGDVTPENTPADEGL